MHIIGGTDRHRMSRGHLFFSVRFERLADNANVVDRVREPAKPALVILIADEQGDALLGAHGPRDEHRRQLGRGASSISPLRSQERQACLAFRARSLRAAACIKPGHCD
jgi:hypothetical protein